MKVTVFGATGAIGQLVVGDLLGAGHSVAAYARDPAKVPGIWGAGVQTLIGEVTDAHAIDAAVAGSDAVVSALGPSLSRKATGLPLVEGTALIIEAMKRHGVRRFVGHATPGVVDRRDARTLQMRLVGWMGKTIYPRAYKEMIGMSSSIMSSGLDWTIVRFTAPKDGAAKGIAHEGFFGAEKIGMAVTRADIAAFTAAQVDSGEYIDAAPAISN
jgi:putative NADH-flavin reductase